MNQANGTPNTAASTAEVTSASRRSLFGPIASLALTAIGTVATAATPAGGEVADHPDRELIATGAEFCRVEGAAAALEDDSPEEIELSQRGAALKEKLCTLRATTLEGAQARVAAMTFWNSGRNYSMDAENSWMTELAAAHWRDMGGRPDAGMTNQDRRDAFYTV